MSDWTLPPCSTLLCGMTGSGKTTFLILYLLNLMGVACRFVFDETGQIAARLRIRAAGTEAECNAALLTRWVVFNPHIMFPGDETMAFRWFCWWARERCMAGSGKKVFAAEEIWKHCSPHSIPRELAALAQMGRADGCELLTNTQLPNKVNASITGQATEVVSFRLDEPLALARISELGLNPDEISQLPLGKFISINRLSRVKLSGRVF